MTAAGKPRIAIVAGEEEAADWAAAFASPSMDVVRVADPATLRSSDTLLVLAHARPEQAAATAQNLATGPTAPPAALLIGGADDGHPLTTLVRKVVSAKREWEATFDAIVDPVTILDPDGRVVRANLQLAGLLGRSIHELVSMHFLDLVGPPIGGGRNPIAESLSDLTARTGDARYERLPGVYQVTSSPLADASGTRQGVVVMLKDVSDLREQQERMLRSARLADIGQLAAGVAHEINTPLASIALRAESLLRHAEDPRLTAVDSFKNFPRYLKTIDDEIFRCKKIIGALLEFSRSPRAEVRETDVNAVAERASDLLGHQMKLKQLAFSFEPASGLPFLQADDSRLLQALVALLTNALDATAPGGRVTLLTRRESPTSVEIAVEDTGVGIPEEHLDKIFNPFFTTKPVGQGTGLGLAICHGIAKAHGGEVRVDSRVGQGTRIGLVLPLHGGGSGAEPPSRGVQDM